MSKYRSDITVVDGIKFRSKREAHRYTELILLVKAGEIKDLQLQVKYSLDVNDVHICNYLADFVYWDIRLCETIVEDSKGRRIQPYQIKAKLMKACHNIDIVET